MPPADCEDLLTLTGSAKAGCTRAADDNDTCCFCDLEWIICSRECRFQIMTRPAWRPPPDTCGGRADAHAVRMIQRSGHADADRGGTWHAVGDFPEKGNELAIVEKPQVGRLPRLDPLLAVARLIGENCHTLRAACFDAEKQCRCGLEIPRLHFPEAGKAIFDVPQ